MCVTRDIREFLPHVNGPASDIIISYFRSVTRDNSDNQQCTVAALDWQSEHGKKPRPTEGHFSLVSFRGGFWRFRAHWMRVVLPCQFIPWDLFFRVSLSASLDVCPIYAFFFFSRTHTHVGPVQLHRMPAFRRSEGMFGSYNRLSVHPKF